MTGPKVNNAIVQVARAQHKTAQVNTSATDGAQIGINLYDQNGNVITASQWNALLTAASGSSNANISLSSFTTDDLDEGAFNLYFTNLRAQNAVASILQNTGSITWSYVSGTSIKAQADLFYLQAIG
jgi:hypothetical protein